MRAPSLDFAQLPLTNLLDIGRVAARRDADILVDDGLRVLTVDDEGPGIDESDRPHVFDRFYRARESRSMPGSGLGLSIVRQAVERHAGSVHVEESPYGGARLVMSLPGAPTPVPDWTPA